MFALDILNYIKIIKADLQGSQDETEHKVKPAFLLTIGAASFNLLHFHWLIVLCASGCETSQRAWRCPPLHGAVLKVLFNDIFASLVHKCIRLMPMFIFKLVTQNLWR